MDGAAEARPQFSGFIFSSIYDRLGNLCRVDDRNEFLFSIVWKVKMYCRGFMEA